VLKTAYEIGALAAYVDAGLVKEGSTAKEVATTLWKATKRGAKNIGRGMRETASKLHSAKAEGGLEHKFLEGLPGTVPERLAGKNIPLLEKTLLEQATPWLQGAGIATGVAGAGYGGYKGLKSLFPNADASRFSSVFGSSD